MPSITCSPLALIKGRCNRPFPFSTLAYALLLVVGSSFAQDNQGASVYGSYCASCHGSQLQGALATSLIKTQWVYGRDDFSFDSNIRNGIPGTDMPAFRDQLSDAQIEAVIEFIYQSQTTPPGIPDPVPATLSTRSYTLQAKRLVTTGLTNPWAIEFVDKHLALITDNDGELFWLRGDQLDPKPITGLPPVDLATSTGGLMDLALDPDYACNGWVYLALSHSEDPNNRYAPGMTRIIRGRVEGYVWTETQHLFRLENRFHLPDSKHWGGRLLFDHKGFLYFSIGDMSAPENAQNPALPAGKVFRINPDGSIPPGNPFVRDASALGAVYTLGNRNVQGLAEHPSTGEIWATEHGPRGGDELNRLDSGRNYGWPEVTFGINYDGSTITELTHTEGMEPPVRQWTPAPAVSPIEFVTGPMFADWDTNLLMGTLAHEELWRLVVRDGQVTEEELLLKGHGRIRDIKISPDGSIYLVLNLPAEIIRLSREGPSSQLD